jgi:membrane-associated phospholipid phosphatase
MWVWFCVIATANHYVLDVLAGIGVAVAALLATAWFPRLFGRLRAAGPVIANLL